MNKIFIICSLVLFLFTNEAEAQDSGNISKRTEEAADTLGQTYEQLDELVLTVKKDVVKTDGSKLTYDMDADDSSKGGSLLEALRKVPMVSIDGEGNIYIRGNKDIKIYVNGKEEPMLTTNASKILKVMPADAVSKIEVITEPGAQYDAEGVGGIINLVTERKQSKDGYTGSLMVAASSQNFGGNAYARVKYDKVTADASVTYANNDIQGQTQINNIEMLDFSAVENYKTMQKMIQKFAYNYLTGNLNLSWEPTDKDLFTVSGNITDMNARVKKLKNNVSIFSRDDLLTNAYLQNIDGKIGYLSAGGNAGYRRIFDTESHNLTFAYRFNFNDNPFRLDYANEETEGSMLLPPFQKSSKLEYQREHTATADYTNSFSGDKHKLDIGVKAIFRRNNEVTRQYAGLDPENILPVMDYVGDTRQIQNIYAAYASYQGKYGNVSFVGGVRYERTYMGMDFSSDKYDSYRRSLNDVVPNASISYAFGPANFLRIAYQMRINRPRVNQMNPTAFMMTQTMVQVGNPNLESEHYNNITINYSKFGQKAGGNIGLSYNQSNNTIENYSYVKGGIIYDTYGNFGKNRKIELNGFFNLNISANMSLSLNGSVDYTTIKSHDSSIGNHGWNGSYGANYSYNGPWKMKYSAYGGQNTGMINLQGRFNGWYYYGLGVSRKFLKNDSLNVSLNASNFLTKYVTFKTQTLTPQFSSRTRTYNRSWNLSLSFTWNFGHLSEQVKKTDASLDTDDAKSSGKGGQSGIGL